MQYRITALHYESTLYLALPVLKQEEKSRVWNNSVIYVTSHPSSATDYKIKESISPHMSIQALECQNRQNQVSVILIKPGFK